MLDENKLAKRKKINQAIAFGILRVLSFSIIVILLSILAFIVYNGISALSWDFLTKSPEDGMTKGGIYPAIIGTMYLVGLSMLIAFPVGLCAGLYINEYAKDGWIKRIILFMTSNLA